MYSGGFIVFFNILFLVLYTVITDLNKKSESEKKFIEQVLDIQ